MATMDIYKPKYNTTIKGLLERFPNDKNLRWQIALFTLEGYLLFRTKKAEEAAIKNNKTTVSRITKRSIIDNLTKHSFSQAEGLEFFEKALEEGFIVGNEMEGYTIGERSAY
ncbi:MAG: hypothetical protein WBG01_10855 [Bacteroidota bacterium]